MDRDPHNPPDPPRPAPPTPAREGAPSPRRPKRGERKSGPPRARGRRPPAGSAPTAPEPDIEETTVEIDGGLWTVRVLGRAGGGASVAASVTAPLLLLGFSATEAEGSPPREALVVGRTLAGLTPAQLEQALRRASPQARDRSSEPVSKRARGSGRQDR